MRDAILRSVGAVVLRRSCPKILVCAVALWSWAALAGVTKTYKHDKYHEDLATAVSQINQATLGATPGFTQGEAFGQIYSPSPSEYPIKILGIDLILGEVVTKVTPPYITKADIEVWLDDSDGQKPTKAEPDWKVSTGDLFDPTSGGEGYPLEGGKGLQIDFDWESPDGHPPVVLSGNIRIVVRFTEPVGNLVVEWNDMLCDDANPLSCGCQKVAVLYDDAPTAGKNFIHYAGLAPSDCSSVTSWAWFEALQPNSGDFILRMRAEVAQIGCEPNCNGKDCGSDGCGGSCGACTDGQQCVQGQCQKIQNPGCTAQCEGKACGSDGCGGVCGTCAVGQSCVQGQCEEPKAPGCEINCNGKDCGDDGCGGVCGVCDAGNVCVQGVCAQDSTPAPDDQPQQPVSQRPDSNTEDKSASLMVKKVSPAWGFRDRATEVAIAGEGFSNDARVFVGGTPLIGVTVESSQLIVALVPANLELGHYMLSVVNGDGVTDSLDAAFEIRSVGAEETAAAGCSASRSIPTTASLILLIAIALALSGVRLASSHTVSKE